ncbi:hypothetical protein AVEN_206814-1 [Araneus ventricosus]|uniref:Uncharacterized protein n=1 Tax=Araneus ventricosus TaxID=182803 RepID=A0A4Y2C7X0_ARAVE|nr:hypothetical protein AVEN_206814-1 [Araneus ventricosus]
MFGLHHRPRLHFLTCSSVSLSEPVLLSSMLHFLSVRPLMRLGRAIPGPSAFVRRDIFGEMRLFEISDLETNPEAGLDRMLISFTYRNRI